MTLQEKLQWFDILQDQFGSPYFTDTEKLLFLNRGQLEYVSNLFPDNEEGSVNIEMDSNVWQNVGPLIWELSDQIMSTSGYVTYTTLVTDLQTLSGDATTAIFKILSVEAKKATLRKEVKVLRHNDKLAFFKNFFKAPSVDNYRYLIQNNSLRILPTDTSCRIIATVLKHPRQMVLTPSIVNTDMPSSTHNEIVAYGLQFAGVASRDEVLSAMNRIQLPQS